MANTPEPARDNDRALAHTGADANAAPNADTGAKSDATATTARRLHNTHHR